MARFTPLFSGSSGNAYYIGSSSEGVLIDAGRSAKQLVNMLRTCGTEPGSVKAIFVTHEHSDHVKGLRVLANRYHIPVYASRGTLQALLQMGCLEGDFPVQEITLDGVECAGMYIQSFRTPHDCAESVGYRVFTADGRSAAVSTDLGYMTDTVRGALCGADLVAIESNHDVRMLQNGPYPYPLKKRILSRTGHLSNVACADELCRMVEMGTTRFVLAHLSAENNTPELAYQTSVCSLSLAGMKEKMDYKLCVAPRENCTGQSVLF